MGRDWRDMGAASIKSFTQLSSVQWAVVCSVQWVVVCNVQWVVVCNVQCAVCSALLTRVSVDGRRIPRSE